MNFFFISFQVKVSITHHKSTDKNDNGRIFMGMKNITIDICRFNSGSISSNLMNIVAGDFRNCSNCYDQCPFTVIGRIKFILHSWLLHQFHFLQGHKYFRNCQIVDDSLFPPVVPAGRYVAHANFFLKSKKRELLIFAFKLFMDVRPKTFAH